MLTHSLDLPPRTDKPRACGLTMVIDSGLGPAEFLDTIDSAGHLIDYVKFGWGTALVSQTIETKMGILRDRGIDFFFGGTLFEKHIQQDRFDSFVELCRSADLRVVEVSNGTLDMSNTEKGAWIRKLSEEFTVLSEVGFKVAANDAELTPELWADYIDQDLANGASIVITEARESGTTGIARGDGAPRSDVLEAISTAAPLDKLLFEAPTKRLQTHLIGELGTNVNLGNIAPRDVISLETLRLGLRSDTFSLFSADGPAGRGRS